MPKLILLPVRGDASDRQAYATALAAARLFDSHIAVLHVTPDVEREMAALAAADMGTATGMDATLSRLEADAEVREQAAAAAWRVFGKQAGIAMTDRPGEAGVTTEYLTEIGDSADWVAEHGRVADLVVTARGDDATGLDLIEAALLNTGRPVLVAYGDQPVFDGTIGIAWKDGKEAAAGVAAALPFIQRARRVLIFTVNEGGARDHSAARLAHALRWHAADVAVKLLPDENRPPAETLLAASVAHGCGLLAMGGYSHARLREAMFGGFTRSVLDHAPLPVLMAH
jgi:nucleotide-binding universal stress UspA family protein